MNTLVAIYKNVLTNNLQIKIENIKKNLLLFRTKANSEE